jgi:SAF domain
VNVDRDPGRVAVGRGFRPATRRRNRIAAGVALAAVAVGGNLLVYANLDSSEPVVQTVRDVPAGARITSDMLRTVDVDAESTVNVVSADRLESLIGTYAKVRLVAGSLVTSQSVQASPLVTPGSAVVAIQVADGALPAGLRERVPILLVMPGRTAEESVASVPGRVVGLPVETASALGLRSLSVEVAAADAATVAAADDVRVVLVEPSTDPAVAAGTADDPPVEGGAEQGEP